MDRLSSKGPQRFSPAPRQEEDPLEHVSCFRFIGGLLIVCLPLLLATPSSATYESFYSVISAIPSLLKSAVTSDSPPAKTKAKTQAKKKKKKVEKKVTRQDIMKSVMYASKKYRVPPSLVLAVISAGSGFDHKAVSPKGAMGLMQLLPTTAKEMGISDPFDPHQNILGGTRYLAYLLNKFEDKPELAVAAFYAGPKTVKRYRGIPPDRKTKKFVKEVVELASR